MKKGMWALLILIVVILTYSAFADVPENDTVNITAYIYAPPNITYIEFEDFAPYNAPPNSDIDLVAYGNKTAYCVFNVTDKDGYANINQSSLNVTIYFAQAGLGSTGNRKYNFSVYWNDTQNNNACINQSFGGGDTYDGWIYYNCSFSMAYFAENGTWSCFANIKDISEKGPWANNTANATVNELIALNISRNWIDFGFLGLGENTTSASYNTTIENIGNVPISVNVTAGWNFTEILDDSYAMKCNISYINETDIYFDDADGSTFHSDIGGADWENLDSGFNSASDMVLNEANSYSVSSTYTIYWGVNLLNTVNMVPRPQGACSGWLFFDALRS
jgi:hypothetical protein